MLWNNLKQRKRKAATAFKYERLLTGGGPEPTEDDDPIMNAVNVAAPHMDVTLPFRWDSTGDYEKKSAEESTISHVSEGNITSQVKAGTSSQVIQTTPRSNNPAVSKRLCRETVQKGATQHVKKEGDLRVQKMQESIQQQRELHDVRLKTEKEHLHTAIALRKKAELEAELAALQLKVFKNENNSFFRNSSNFQ